MKLGEKLMSSGVVYIVHHIDTEGPLCEPTSEVFKRVESTLGIKIDLFPSRDNLNKLQNGYYDNIDLNISKEIKKILDPHLINFKSSWAEVDEMLYRVLDKSYRNKLIDSYGNGWIYNWHIVDHVGFLTNERARDMGYLNIFNHYERILKETNSLDDDIQLHFHTISFFREAHMCATSLENSYWELNQILCRRLIEKNWFPQVYRAGYHVLRPDSNWFLEQWLPYDASNQSVEEEDNKLQLDQAYGRLGDWKGAPSDWSLYNPDLYDWRKRGNLKRYIARVLNLKTRFRNINEYEIKKAFNKAKNGNCNVYLGITNHDFREMSTELNEFYNLLTKVSKEYPTIKFKFSRTLNAFRDVIGYSKEEINNNRIELEFRFDKNVLIINAKKGEVFGAQPYLAIKTVTNEYFHDNFDFGEFKKEYYYTFDRMTIFLSQIDTIAFASNDKYGNFCIINLKFKHGELIESKKIKNER
jgi:hypothetical protein